jgi:hypothetical protein
MKAGRIIPALSSLIVAATAFVRGISIRKYQISTRNRVHSLKNDPRVTRSLSTVHKEHGRGTYSTIVIGGFVPDATEAVEFQRHLFKKFGSIYFINYSRNGFSTDTFLAELGDLIEDIGRCGEKPILFCISYGCGLALEFLRSRFCPSEFPIGGLVLVSPVLCMDDLIRPAGVKHEGVRLLEVSLKRILKSATSEGSELNRHIERGRRAFQSLFETGAGNRKLSLRHLSIRKGVMETLVKTSSLAGYERVLALKELSVPTADVRAYSGPTLTLLSEGEEDILVPTSPSLELFRDPEKAGLLFPNGVTVTVSSNDTIDPVSHASLIFHQHDYNAILENWYSDLIKCDSR